MIIPSSLQIYFFLCAAAGGVIVGVLIDSYRSIRYWCRPKNKSFLTAVSDMLFWILCAIIIFIFFLYTNNGDFRYYTIIGMGLGLLLYFKALSSLLLKGIRWFIYFVWKVIRILWRVVVFPVKAAVYAIGFVRSMVSSFAYKQGQKLKSKKPPENIKKQYKKEGKSAKIKNNKLNKHNKAGKKNNTKEKVL